MTGGQALALAVLAAGLAPAAGLGLAGIGWLARLWFRYQIEAVRYDGVLAVIDGDLPPAPAVTGWLAALGTLAARARWRDVAPGPGLAAGVPVPPPAGLAPAQQAVIDALALRVRAAAGLYRARGRPGGVLRYRMFPPATRPGDGR